MQERIGNQPSTDDFFRDALESRNADQLIQVEKKIIERMLQNQESLHERAEMIFNALDRRYAFLQSKESNEIGRESSALSNRYNRWIALATMATVFIGILFGCLQWRGSVEQTRLQRAQLESEYRPYLGTYFSVENETLLFVTSSTENGAKNLAGCNYRQVLFDKKTTTTVFVISVKNYGKTPAKYHLSDLKIQTPSSTQDLEKSLLSIPEGYLMPGERLEVRYQVQLEKIRVEPQFGVEDMNYVASISYRQLGKDFQYSSEVIVKPKPTQNGSRIFCSEIVNGTSS